ncbi:MAG: hypothetical protein ABEJ89_02905 [Haloarculaceae archaeon]
MLTLDVDNFLVEFKDGAVKNAGAPNKRVTAKLYDVEGVDVRAFGDERVKLAFEDAEGNDVEVALFPEEARALQSGLAAVEEAEPEIFESDG